MSRLRVLTAATAASTLVAGLSVARAQDPVPDFELFKARIEPVLQSVCSQCHAGKGKGRFALIVHAPGAPFPEDEHRKNYETVLKLLVPGQPERSPFLQMPLANSADGVKHGGGDRIFRGTPTYRSWVDFIEGAALPASPARAQSAGERGPVAATGASTPTVGDRGLVLEAESLDSAGDVLPADLAGASGRAMAPGAAGGRLSGRFRVPRAGAYALTVRAAGAGKTLAVRIDDREPLAVEVEKDALGDAVARVACDGGRPFEAVSGTLTVVDGGLRMEGSPARFLSPADVGHTRVEARISDATPGAEAYLLFDLADDRNGKLVGLARGGAEMVLGVVEGGRTRILARAPRPPGLPGERIAVEYVSGIAVGRLDGKPLLHVNFDRALGAGRFGFEARGALVLRDLVAAHGDREVHRMRPSQASVVSLRPGDHRIEVVLPAGGPTLDSVSLRLPGSPQDTPTDRRRTTR